MKIELRDVRIRVTARFRREGSVIAGTARSWADLITTEVSLSSEAPDERIAQLMRMSEASCYTIGSLREPTRTELVVTANGRRLEL